MALIKRSLPERGVLRSQLDRAERLQRGGAVVGYADGVPRGLSNQIEVWLGGRRFRIVGRVCMDQLVVDLGPDGCGVAEGDQAVLFGRGRRVNPRRWSGPTPSAPSTTRL